MDSAFGFFAAFARLRRSAFALTKGRRLVGSILRRLCFVLSILAATAAPARAQPSRSGSSRSATSTATSPHGTRSRSRRISSTAAITGPAVRRSLSRPATSSTVGPTRSRSSQPREAPARSSARRRPGGGAGRQHEAMNMLGDLRYVDPGDFAAFATPIRRGCANVFTKPTRCGSRRHTAPGTPAITDQAIHDAWIAQYPLGKLEHQVAWSPTGELGRWTIANPAVAKIGNTLFVHGGLSVRYAGVPIDEINRRTAAALTALTDTPEFDPQRSVRSAVVSRVGHANGGAAEPGLDAPTAGRCSRPHLPIDRRRIGDRAALDRDVAHGHRPHPDPVGDRDFARGPAGADRYRHLALLRRQIDLSRDHRRPPCAARFRPLSSSEALTWRKFAWHR